MRAQHIALRLAPNRSIDGKTFSIVDEHNRVAVEHGKMALAKFGSGLGLATAADLRAGLEGGDRPYLFAVSKREREFEGFCAPIVDLFGPVLPPMHKHLVPAYYAELDLNAGSWFLLGGPLSRCGLGNLHLASNGRPLVQVLRESRTSLLPVLQDGLRRPESAARR